MKNQVSNFVFDQERASNYDKQFAELAPMRDALPLERARTPVPQENAMVHLGENCFNLVVPTTVVKHINPNE